MTITPMPGKKPNVIINISHRIYVGTCQKKNKKPKNEGENQERGRFAVRTEIKSKSSENKLA